MKGLQNRKGRMDRPLLVVYQKFLRSTLLVFTLCISYASIGQTVNLPSVDKCTSKDLELLDARLSGSDQCISCDDNTPPPAQTLILTIDNKTGSTRTSFAFWGTLEIYNRGNNTTVPNRSFAIKGCAGPIPKNVPTPVDFNVQATYGGEEDVLVKGGLIQIQCGQRLRITNLFMAWTDASQKSACETIDPATISPKCGVRDAVVVNTGVGATATITDITCSGGASGAISLNPSGGTAPYTFTWSAVNGGVVPSDQTNSRNLTGLVAGTYSVLIIDSRTCRKTETFVVGQPSTVTASASVTTPVSCFGDKATVTVSASGGTGALSYTFNGETNSTGVFTNVPAGTKYAWSVTDQNTCAKSGTLDVAQPSTITASASVTSPIACNGNKATVTVSGSGGTGSLTYVLNGVSNSTGIFTEVSAGQNYTWSVTDASGCSKTGVLTVSQPDELKATVNSQLNVSCSGVQNGSVVIAGSGGNAGYMYSIDGKDWQASGSFANLSAGNYTLTVKDAKGCTATQQVNITQPNAVTANASVTTAIGCNGGAATVTVSASGGTGVFSYTFNGQTNSTGVFTGVRAGQNYAWSVSDGNSCVQSGTLSITEPEALSASIRSQENISCFGANDGTISVDVTGGTAPYSYDWADLSGDNDPKDRTGLTAGNYSLTVSDAKGCTSVLTASVTEGKRLDKPVVIIHDGVNSLCSTPTLPSLEVCSPALDVTYVLYDKDNKKIGEVTPDLASPNVVFNGLEPGSGFKVVARYGNCESDATVCGEQLATCPQSVINTQVSTSSIQSAEQPKADDQLTAYPVPFSENVTLEFKAERDGNYEINLYDMRGTVIRKLKAGTARAGEVTQIEVDGRMMAEGMYLARMVSNSGAKTVKLLKKK